MINNESDEDVIFGSDDESSRRLLTRSSRNADDSD